MNPPQQYHVILIYVNRFGIFPWFIAQKGNGHRGILLP